jgi:hypothetical protein
MAQHAKPPHAATLRADRALLTALKGLPDYAPRNPECTLAALHDFETAASRAEEALLEADRIRHEARARMIAATWAFHDAARRTKIEVESQYGDDSYAVQAIGLTRRSARKRPARRKAAAE